jgi:putative intracellular protease/amidase
MFQFRDPPVLQDARRRFAESGRPTAALCHGVAALIDVRLSDGSHLVRGRTLTGFANVEEDFSDAAAGQRIMPFRVEDELRARGANYVQAGLFKAFAIRDGNLITGQQQYSGARVAQLVVAALGA